MTADSYFAGHRLQPPQSGEPTRASSIATTAVMIALLGVAYGVAGLARFCEIDLTVAEAVGLRIVAGVATVGAFTGMSLLLRVATLATATRGVYFLVSLLGAALSFSALPHSHRQAALPAPASDPVANPMQTPTGKKHSNAAAMAIADGEAPLRGGGVTTSDLDIEYAFSALERDTYLLVHARLSSRQEIADFEPENLTVSYTSDGLFYMIGSSLTHSTEADRISVFADSERLFGELPDVPFPVHYIDVGTSPQKMDTKTREKLVRIIAESLIKTPPQQGASSEASSVVNALEHSGFSVVRANASSEASTPTTYTYPTRLLRSVGSHGDQSSFR